MLKSFVKNKLKKVFRSFIPRFAKFTDIDLLLLAHKERGILNYQNLDVSGERHLISVWLPQFLKRNGVSDPFFLDIGANRGDYSRMLLQEYPEAHLTAFEPNPHSFRECREVLRSYPKAEARNIGIGSENSVMELHIPNDQEKSSHASLYPGVLDEQHAYADIRSHEASVMTIDGLFDQKEDIHFTKIDTEGHEYDALKGAVQSIEAGKIWSVQFEFNEMNVISRVFLRDYFELLSDYNFYRLVPGGLDPLEYDTREEIFKYQNILAVHESRDIQ